VAIPGDDDTTAALTEALAALRGPAGDAQPPPDSAAFQRYFHGIAEAHYVIRKVFRIVDTQARAAGLDPLEHKVLIQSLGAPGAPLRINDVAARLDIAPALASRLITGLEVRGLLARARGESDRRTTRVTATHEGRELLARIDEKVRLHVAYFQTQLTDAERVAALQIFGFYLGAGPAAP
jgi:DNA-binding MarR family transcriptional regulator